MRLLLALAIIAVSGCGRAPGGTAEIPKVLPSTAAAYTTSDGWPIQGDYFAAPNATRAVVLLHQRGGSAGDWSPLVARLVKAGIGALAIDQRGAGRSTGKQANEDETWDTQPDIAGAVGWLKAKGIPEAHISLAGASYGANNAILYAEAHPNVPAVALVSPGANYHGLVMPADLRGYKGSILVLAAQEDSIMGGGLDAVRRAAPAAEVKTVPGSAHGTQLLATNPESLDTLSTFLTSHL